MSSLAIRGMSNKLIDCYGSEYEIIRMAGTGFCGFHCLSFCLSGNQLNYADIIHDCINVFFNVPELFRLRTNFGLRDESSLSFNDYMSLMCQTIYVHQGSVNLPFILLLHGVFNVLFADFKLALFYVFSFYTFKLFHLF